MGDRRVQRFKEREKKVSRLVARRNAIIPTSTTKLRVATAVNSLRLKNPTHYRTLAKLCEAGGGRADSKDTYEDEPAEQTKELSATELIGLSKEFGLPIAEIQSLFGVFEHYDFDMSGNLDREEILSLMADMGLQARTAEEKREVNEIIDYAVGTIKKAASPDQEDGDEEASEGSAGDDEEPPQIVFRDFLMVMNMVSSKLRELQAISCLQLFQTADVDHSGTLDMQETLDIMEIKLGLVVHNDEERSEVQVIFDNCDKNGDGAVVFEEFQEFIQRARARLLMMRRDREMTIAKAFQLNKGLVKEFTTDLPKLWDLFQRYDHKGKGVVLWEDVSTVLMDIGISPSEPHTVEFQVSEELVSEVAQPHNDFTRMLKIIAEARRRCKANIREQLYEQFLGYDKDMDGHINMTEIYQILGEFDMLPKSKEQQHAIVYVIDKLDTDGSGTFDFEEFQNFFQTLQEHVRMSERERQREAVVKLGFKTEDIAKLCRVYQQLYKTSMSNYVTLQMLGKNMQDLRTLFNLLLTTDEEDIKIFAAGLLREADRLLDFTEFSRIVKLGLMDAAEEDNLSANERLKRLS